MSLTKADPRAIDTTDANNGDLLTFSSATDEYESNAVTTESETVVGAVERATDAGDTEGTDTTSYVIPPKRLVDNVPALETVAACVKAL